MPSIVCKCGPAFTQNLFTILGILLVLALVVRFFSKQVYPELWDKLTAPFNPTEVEGPMPPLHRWCRNATQTHHPAP